MKYRRIKTCYRQWHETLIQVLTIVFVRKASAFICAIQLAGNTKKCQFPYDSDYDAETSPANQIELASISISFIFLSVLPILSPRVAKKYENQCKSRKTFHSKILHSPERK